MTKTLPSYSEQNPHPTAVIREMRYMVRNAMAFHAPISSWCLETGLIKGSPAMGGLEPAIYLNPHASIERIETLTQLPVTPVQEAVL